MKDREPLQLARSLASRRGSRIWAAPVSMGVVCFRFTATDESKIDQANGEIVERINASGLAYLTQTKLNGRTVMRVGLGNILTTEQHLRNAWELIQATASAV